MDERGRARAMAEHTFTRIVLADLMAAECMRQTDPLGFVDQRAKAILAAGDTKLDERGDLLSHLYLHEMETFWEGVREDVQARLQFRGSAS